MGPLAGTVTEAAPGAFGSVVRSTRLGSVLVMVPENGVFELPYIDSSVCSPFPSRRRSTNGSEGTWAGGTITRTLYWLCRLLTPAPGWRPKVVTPDAVQVSKTETPPN